MNGNRGIDTEVGRENREVREIWRAIEALQSERRASATSVDTGSFTVTSAGQEIFRIGDMEFGDRGLAIRRENGAPALEMRKLSSGAFVGQSVAMYDAADRVVSTEDLFGGLRTPYLEHPFQPIAASSGTAVTCGPYGWERVTTSGTFETLFVYDGKRQNPYLDIKVAVKPSDTTTSAEVRVVNLATGTALSSFSGGSWLGVVGTGSSAYTVVDPAGTQVISADAGGSLAAIRLGIQARRTAGAGSITLAVPQAIGG